MVIHTYMHYIKIQRIFILLKHRGALTYGSTSGIKSLIINFIAILSCVQSFRQQLICYTLLKVLSMNIRPTCINRTSCNNELVKRFAVDR